jgi:2-succinyl-6-hydroxy-2,4-cyclohexadiene-1-carboxylate synthase
MKLHFEMGPGTTGPYLLLVHGFLSSRAQWRPNLEGLSAFCRPVIVELWGHGRSPIPDDPAAYQVASYLDAFDGIRRELGAEQWLVCGQSFGAGLTIRYTHRHPTRVLGQIFTNSLSALSAPGERETDQDRLTRADALEAGGRAAVESLRFHPRFATRFPPDVQREMLDDADQIPVSAVANAIRHTVPQLSVVDCLGEVSVPSLLINGLWERPFQPLRERALQLLPSLQVVDLDGGHSVNVEAPDGFNAAVGRFVAGFTSLSFHG